MLTQPQGKKQRGSYRVIGLNRADIGINEGLGLVKETITSYCNSLGGSGLFLRFSPLTGLGSLGGFSPTLGAPGRLWRRLRSGLVKNIFTGHAAFRIALNQPGDIRGERLSETTFGCDLLPGFINRIF